MYLKYLEEFIGRKDAYMVRENGKWRKEIGNPLSVLNRHINDPDFAIGSYPIYWENNKPRCRWICIDLDAHDESESKEEILNKINILYSQSEEYFLCENKYLIVEESDRGYHIWIILEDDTWLSDAWLYVNYIKPKIEELCGQQEFFPAQSHLNITPEGYGNGVKLPLYNGENIIYPDSKEINKFDIKPFRREAKIFLANLEHRNQLEKPEPEKRMLDRHEWKRKEVSVKLEKVYNSPWIRPCIKAVIDGRFQCRGDFGHKMRVAVANDLLELGLPIDEVIEAFKNQDDFNETKTRKAIEYSERKQKERRNPMKFRCETIKKLGFCLDNCSWRFRGATSPHHQVKILPPDLGKEFIKEHLGKEEVESWEELFKIMEAIYEYNNKKFFLIKTTRSGTTTACLAEGFKMGRRILMVAPTKRIFDSTVREAIEIYYKKFFKGRAIRTYRVKSNIESCKKLKNSLTKEEIKEIQEIFPFLLKPECEKCGSFENCGYIRFLDNIYNYDLIYLTTRKFLALIASPNGSDLLKSLINWCDVVFIDEFSNIFSVNYSSQVLIDTEEGVNNLDSCRTSLRKLLSEDIHIPTEMKEMIYSFIKIISNTIYNDFLLDNKNKVYYSSFENKKFRDYLSDHPHDWVKVYSTIYKYFRKTKDKSLGYFVMAFLALSSKKVYLQQRIDPFGEREISLAYVDDINAILNWLRRIDSKLLITTDAVYPIIPPHEILDNLQYVRILDPNRTHEKQKIIVFDNADPFYKLTEEVKRDIKQFLKEHRSNEEAFLIVRSKRVYKFYKTLKKTYKDEDWFRGKSTIGVKNDLRKMIILGGPYPPRHSYDCSVKIYQDAGYFKDGEFKDMNFEEIGRYFENYNAAATFFQTISRVKDPRGIEESRVFVYGIPIEEVKKLLFGLKEIKILTYEEYKNEQSEI